MGNIVRIGTRPSTLALRQAEEIRALFPRVDFEVRTYHTPGDRDRVTPLSDVEGSDFFTRELDEALLRQEIDLAVHSSKDLPGSMPPGLKLALETASISRYECLVCRSGLGFRQLPAGSSVGASSRRRKERIRYLRPDLLIVDVRGDIEERLRLVDKGVIEAIVVAHAAMIRLGLETRIAQLLDPVEFPAHPKQGSLSLLVREDRWQEVESILSEPAPETGS